MAKTIVFYLQTDGHGRCIGSQSQSEGNGLPSCDNDFETARLGVFATPGSPRVLTIPDLRLRMPGLTKRPRGGNDAAARLAGKCLTLLRRGYVTQMTGGVFWGHGVHIKSRAPLKPGDCGCLGHNLEVPVVLFALHLMERRRVQHVI